MRVIQKMKKLIKPVQEQKMRIGTDALCRSLFGDEETQMTGQKTKGERRLFSRYFFDDCAEISKSHAAGAQGTSED